MVSMPTGASWRTASCTAASGVNIQAAPHHTAPTAPARIAPITAPLLHRAAQQLLVRNASVAACASSLTGTLPHRQPHHPTPHRSSSQASCWARFGSDLSRASRLWAVRLRGSGK